MATAQLNVRLDADLKAAGDEVLGRLGVSSVQVVRDTWGYIVDHQKLPDFIQAGSTQRKGGEACDAPGAAMAVRLAREAGLRAELEYMTFDELRESAYEEMLREDAERHA